MPTPPDVNPIRPGAAPRVSAAAAGLAGRPDYQPAWATMTATLVRWLRYHFGAAARIEHPDLVGYVWTANQETNPITITSLAEWRPIAAAQRPALLVDRLDQDLDQSKAGIGELLMGGPPRRYAHFMAGGHVVHCIGGKEGEAEHLAFEVWRELSRFAHVAREKLCLHRFRAAKIGKRVKIEDQMSEGNPHFSTPVYVMYYYEESWKVVPQDETEITAVVFRPGGL